VQHGVVNVAVLPHIVRAGFGEQLRHRGVVDLGHARLSFMEVREGAIVPNALCALRQRL
jgi:hypothetical protein